MNGNLGDWHNDKTKENDGVLVQDNRGEKTRGLISLVLLA